MTEDLLSITGHACGTAVQVIPEFLEYNTGTFFHTKAIQNAVTSTYPVTEIHVAARCRDCAMGAEGMNIYM